MMEYEDYIKLMMKQIKKHDVRERVFQDNIIRPFLFTVFSELDIEPVDVKIATKIHDYEQYCGSIKVNDKIKMGTPDLCIADEWYWNNRDIEVNYRCVVEIKSPYLDTITGFLPNKYKKHTLDEIEQYLKAERNSKIILTDGITWTFYNKEYGMNPVIEPISLGEVKYKYRKGRNNKLVVERDSSKKPIIEKIIFYEDEKVFNRLVTELQKFV